MSLCCINCLADCGEVTDGREKSYVLQEFFLNSVENDYTIGDRWYLKISAGRFGMQYLK
jgi:hypothetical protein